MGKKSYEGTLRLNESVSHKLKSFEPPERTSISWQRLESARREGQQGWGDVEVAFFSKTLIKLRAPREMIFLGAATAGTPNV